MKRSDLDTATVLRTIAVRGLDAYDVLTERFPAKIVLAAYLREDNAGRIEYGTSIGYPWLTPEGRQWLADRPQARVTVPVDVDRLRMNGWHAFLILDAGIRKGVASLGRQPEYRSAELESGEWTRGLPTGTMTFLVDVDSKPAGGPVHSQVDADTPPPGLPGCMFADRARVFVLPDRTEGSGS